MLAGEKVTAGSLASSMTNPNPRDATGESVGSTGRVKLATCWPTSSLKPVAVK